jgi:hypothetical protein
VGAPVVPGADALMKVCPSLTIIWDTYERRGPAAFRPGPGVIGYGTQSVVRVILLDLAAWPAAEG